VRAGETSEGAGAGGALGARLRLLAAAGLFSIAGAGIKRVGLGGWQVACFRSGVAALALLTFLPETRRRPSPRILLIGAVYASTMILFVLANKLTTSASAIFLQAVSPLYVLLLAPWLLKEKVLLPDLLYMGALAAGLFSFFVERDPVSVTAPDPRLGNLLAAASGVFWAMTIMGLRWLGRERRSGFEEGEARGPSSVLWGNALAFAITLPFALPVRESRPADWLIIALLGVFQLALAYVLLLRGLQRVPALEASLLLLLEPVLNPVWTWLVHGERPGRWSLAGGCLILLATAVRTWVDVRREPPAGPVLIAPP
jgi:drug/metabolite transporter (DMT)-like permease